MSNIIKFIEGKKRILRAEDFYDFFKKDKKIVIDRFSDKLSCYYDEIIGVEDKVLDGVYALRRTSYLFGKLDFEFLLDDNNKCIIINEAELIDKISMYPDDRVNLSSEDITLLSNIRHLSVNNIDVDDIAKFMDEFVVGEIGGYKVLGAISIYKNTISEVNEYIYSNIDKFAEAFKLDEEANMYAEKKSKEMYVGFTSSQDFNINIYTLNSKSILEEVNKSSFLYNCYASKDIVVRNIKDDLESSLINLDTEYKIRNGLDKVEKFIHIRRIYKLKKAEELLGVRMEEYKNDVSLNKMKDIVSTLKPEMKTVVVNGIKVENDLSFNFDKNEIVFRNKDYSTIERISCDKEIKITYGRKILYQG